jgi:hypothetical protein
VRVPADRRVLLIAIVAGVASACWHEAPRRDTPLTNRTPGPVTTGWRMTQRGVGPIDATTSATLGDLRRVLPSLRVVAHDLGEASGIVFDVFEGTERLAYVVPDDAIGKPGTEEHQYATTVFAVFAVSPRISVAGRTWRVGQPFQDASGLDRCECWGSGEVTACFQVGSHLRVIFEEACEQVAHDARALIGRPIARIMWKRVLEPPGLLDD